MEVDKHWPEVSLIIAAYNEADLILEKAYNSLQLNYPKEKLKIVFVTDGSNDGTPELLQTVAGVTVYHQPERKGKLAAVNRVIEEVESEIIVLTDANCLLNHDAIRNLVRHYQDEHVGAVAGEKKIRKDFAKSSTAGAGEGIYWQYESWLKKMDSDLNSVIGAAGELFSFRKSLYECLPPNTIIEDFVLSMRIAMKGYRVVYEPEAYAVEAPSVSIAEEWKRKVRICAGAFQAFQYLPHLWNPFQYGILSFQYVAHRFMRWAVVPFLIPVILILTGVLAVQSDFYEALFVLELFGVLLAGIGIVLADRIKIPKLVMISSYIMMMNAAAYAGLFRHWTKSQNVVWEKAKRHLL